jgi:hypothetical protein
MQHDTAVKSERWAATKTKATLASTVIAVVSLIVAVVALIAGT